MARDLSIDDLRELLEYDPLTGAIRYKVRKEERFRSTGRGGRAGACARWNGRCAGKLAFKTPLACGHLTGRIWGRSYRTGPVAWAIFYGVWPTHFVDHINGDPTDNRIQNLRDVPQQVNMMNKCRQSNNRSGVTGVFRSDGKWHAAVKYKGKVRRLGRFDDLADAAEVRKKAALALGFTERHGLAAAK